MSSSSSPLISVTLRCYPRPPPAPPRLRPAPGDQQVAAHRLVHAAAFAAPTGEVNLRDVGDSTRDTAADSATAAPAESRLAPPPAPYQPPSQPISSLSFYHQKPPPLATQAGILRRRPSNELIGTQTQDGARSRKKVRLKSPTDPTREAGSSVRVASSASAETRSRTRSSLHIEQEVTVEVEPPSSGTDFNADVTGLVERYDDPAEGAFERCIPFPYRHTRDYPTATNNPVRQHPAKIRHSFLDSSPMSGSSHPPQTYDPRSYPSALASLAPGRRGAWIIPVSGALPIPQTSSSTWCLPPSIISGLGAPIKPQRSSKGKLKTIEWTDARLIALWTVLTSLHQRAPMGEVKTTCFLSSTALPSPSLLPRATPSRLSSPLLSSHAQSLSPWPDHIRIAGDAHLALPLRGLISIVTAKQSGRAEDQYDTEKFLEGARLVWVDEAGRPVLVA